MIKVRIVSRVLAPLAAALTLMMGMPTAQAQQQGGVLRAIVQPEPPMLNHALNLMAPTQYVGGKIFQGLVSYGFDFEMRPELAKSWDISQDSRVYTFHLEENVKWHDGKPFTADDVVFTIGSLLLKESPRVKVLLEGRLESVEALDTHTVRLTLKEPFPPLALSFDASTVPILPKHVYEGTDFRANPANQRPIGTGPFKFEEWRRGEFIRLTRNPDYWKEGLPYLDGIVFQIVPDAASRAVAFEKGVIDVLRGGDVDNVDVNRLKSLPGVEITTKGWEMYAPMATLHLNQRHPVLKHREIRQAIMHALNRKMIVENIFLGQGAVATGPFAASTKFYDPNVPQYEFDPKKARELIKSSGVDVSEPLRLVAFGYGSQWDRLEEYIKQMLRQIGLNVVIEPGDAGTWASRLSNWDFDMTLTYTYQLGDPAVGVQRLFVASNIVKGGIAANNQGYDNPEADKLWEKAAVSPDPAERQKLYTQIQTILNQDVANAFLFEIYFPTLYRDKVKNLVQGAIGLNESFDNVYIEEKPSGS